MSDVASEVDLETRYVVFIPAEGTRMQLFGVEGETAVEAIEAQLSEVSGKPLGSVAYYVGEAGAEKQQVANAAKNAGLAYISSENILRIKTLLKDYSNDFSMAAILEQHKRIASRAGSPERGRWAEPTDAELQALENGGDVLTLDSLS